jgi:hypothetical protein
MTTPAEKAALRRAKILARAGGGLGISCNPEPTPEKKVGESKAPSA